VQLRDALALGRVFLRQLALPLALLGLLVLYVRGGVAVPALGGASALRPAPRSGLPLSGASLHYLLGAGLPTLGGAHPSAGLFGVGGGALGAIGLYAMAGVVPHDPSSLFGSAFAGFGVTPRGAAKVGLPLTQWLGRLPKTAATRPQALPGGLRSYGRGTPLVGLYATEGLQAFVGHGARANQPPPTSQNPSQDVLGLIEPLGQQLATDGVPSVGSLQRNDSEGELGVYLKSYAVARGMLKAEPQLALVLDLERPAQPPTPATTLVGGKRLASVALVVGTGADLPQPYAAQNLELARSLGAYLGGRLGSAFVGIVRSPDRLNQQISPTMLTIDIGGPAATPAEAKAVLPGIALAIADFLGGAPAP